MTDLLSDVETPSDAELISRVRGGDVAAYGDLFSRHKDAANRLARQLVRGPDADDLVSEAFAKVLSVLQGGGGPDVAFRAYLLTSVRRLHVDRVRSGQRLQTTDDMTQFDPGVPFQDTAVAGFESGAAAKAFASLPERWQLVLWHLEVEGQKPADIAPLLGMSANSVSALAYRAREGLRQAFLTMHISDLTDSDCRWVNEHLGAFVRKGLSNRDATKVQSHLDECRRCTAMYLELTEVNSDLSGIIAPLLLGAAATGYLASTGVGATGLLGLLSRAKEFVGANTGAVAAAGVSAAVVAAAVAAVTLSGGGDKKPDIVAEAPAGASTPAAPSSGTTGPDTTKPSRSPGASTSPGSAAALVPTAPAASDVPAAASPTDGQTDAVVSLVDLTGTEITDQGVHLMAQGPALPPQMTVLLTSDPGGLLFGSSPDCNVSADGSSAVCSPGDAVGAGAAGAPGAAARTAPATTFTADLPFDPNAGPDTADVSISVDLPDGFQLVDGSGALQSHHFVRPTRVKNVDVALAPSLTPASARPQEQDVYSLSADVSVGGAGAGDLPWVMYHVTGGSFLVDGSTSGTVGRAPSTVSPTFDVAPDTPGTPTRVSISAMVPDGFQDTDGSNDTAAASVRRYDVSLRDLTAGSTTADGSGTQVFTATLGGDAFPGTLEFGLDGEPEGTTLTSDVSGDVVTFTVTSDRRKPFDVVASVRLPNGFTDGDSSDNTAGGATFTPQPLETDLSLSGPSSSVLPEDDGTYLVDTTLGITGDVPPMVTFALPDGGASFSSVDGCSVTTDGATATCANPVSGSTYTFVLEVPTPLTENGTVDISVGAPGYEEINGSDNTTTVTLQAAPAPRYDVSLTDLVALDDFADAKGAQRFTALLDRGGFDGAVTFSLEGAPAGDTLTPTTTSADGTVRFTVTSSATPSHDFRIRVGAVGTNDPNADNDVSSSTWSPHRYDVKLTGLKPLEEHANETGAQRFTATLDRAGFDGPVSFSLVGAVGRDTVAWDGSFDGLVTFTVTSSAITSHSFQIRADAPDADDPATDNNVTKIETWVPKPPPTVEFGFVGSPKASNKSGNVWTVVATVDGVPSGTSVSFGLDDPSEFSSTTTAACLDARGNPNISNGGRTLTCTPGTDGPFEVTLAAKLPGQPGGNHGDITASIPGQPQVTAKITD